MPFFLKKSAGGRKNVTSRKKNGQQIISKSKRCGLVFPVARVQRLLKTSKAARCPRISVSAAGYLAAVLEYLTSELVDLAGNVAKSMKRKTITPRYIMLAATSDAEILQMLPNVTFPFSGVTPSINSALLSKPASRKSTPNIRPTNPSQPKASNKSRQSTILRKITLPGGQTLEIVQADITELTVDAVVNPTNAGFYMGGMVGSCLTRKGGPVFSQLMAETARTAPPLAELAAHATDGPGLKCGRIIHVNSPKWDAGQANEKLRDLEVCVENVFRLAMQEGFTSIALPSIGSGRSNFPKAAAAETIVRKIKQLLSGSSYSLNVQFVLFDQDSIDFYVHEINRTT